MTTQHSLRTELPLLALLALLWGSSYLFIKVAVTEIPPVTLIALRVTGAAGFLLVVMRLRGETLPQDWRTRRMLLLQAFFNSIGRDNSPVSSARHFMPVPPSTARVSATSPRSRPLQAR